MIFNPDAIINPGAMMIESLNALMTNTAMPTPNSS